MALLFAYTARARDGRFVSGTVAAGSRDSALFDLRSRALFVTALEATDSARSALPRVFSVLPVAHGAYVALFRSLATLVHAGVTLQRALDVSVEQCADRRLYEALSAAAFDVRNGSPLSDALARHPREFPRMHVAMIRAGEVGGVLDDVLERLAALLEQERSLRKRISSALAYPAVVGVSALGLLLFLIGSTVPAFAGIFRQMQIELPPTTRMLLAAGNLMSSPLAFPVFAAAVLVVVFLVMFLRNRPGVRAHMDRIALLLPLIGSIIRKSTCARLARMFGSLIRSGVAIDTAFTVACDVIGSAVYRAHLEQSADLLRQGERISRCFEARGLFEPLFRQLVHVGEETGTLDAMLLRLAEYYDVDVDAALTALASIVEPALIVGLGAIVGVIVGSILLPLYSVIGSIR